jgi:hypothetical protein
MCLRLREAWSMSGREDRKDYSEGESVVREMSPGRPQAMDTARPFDETRQHHPGWQMYCTEVGSCVKSFRDLSAVQTSATLRLEKMENSK